MAAASQATPQNPEQNRHINVPFKISWSRQPDMSIHEQRLLLRIMEYCQAQINGVATKGICQATPNHKTVEITMPLSDVFFSRRVSPKEAEECLLSLHRHTFQFQDKNMWWSCGYIEHPEVRFGQRIMSFGVYHRLWEIIKAYAEGFHKVELHKALNLPTSYAIRFYLLVSENKTDRIEMSVDVFKNWLGIPEDKYRDKKGNHRIDNLEERIIKPSKQSLDESCPYTFTYSKVRENPRNPKSRVVAFEFVPVEQPHMKDPELERKRLISEIAPSFLLSPEVYDYLKTNYGMTGPFLNPRKAKIKQWEDLEADPVGWLAARRRLAHEASTEPRNYIFGAMCRRIDELLGREETNQDMDTQSSPPQTINEQVEMKRKVDDLSNELANLFNPYDH